MNLARFDRLAIGLVLVLGIFFIEITNELGSLLYLISAIYILRFSGPNKHVIGLAIATSLSIVIGYFFSINDVGVSVSSIINRAIPLATVWICLYANLRFDGLLRSKKQD